MQAKNLSELIKEEIITLRVKPNPKNSAIENKILFDEIHFNRGDVNEYCIRSTQSRVKYKNEDFKPKDITDKLKIGQIVIGNNNFGQYKGELQLIKKEHKNNKRKNIVAEIIDDEKMLVELIKPWSKFKFVKC